MDIYRQQILEHYKNPRNFGRLKNPDASHEEGNPLCGDKIGMEIKVTKLETGNRKLETVKFWGEGCAISMASASMLTEKIKSQSLEEIKKLTKNDVLKMLGTELSPVRLKCALLPLEVLQKTISLVR